MNDFANPPDDNTGIPARLPDDTPVRYIKLGPGGSWARRCIAEGLVEFSQISVPPELITAQDRDSWVRYFHAMNHAKGQATSVGTHSANQWLSFSTLPQDGLWITFEDDHLWWTFAAPEIQPVGTQAGGDRGFYTRRSINGWQKTSLNGIPLRKSALSTLLTSVSGYQRTICEVRARGYRAA